MPTCTFVLADWIFAPMTATLDQTGIAVRTGGHCLDPDQSHTVMAATFRKIVSASRQLRSDGAGLMREPDEQIDLSAEMLGLCILFAQMLRAADPLQVISGRISWDFNGSPERIFRLLHQEWLPKLTPLVPEEDTDDTWSLFFDAVQASDDPGLVGLDDLIEKLADQAPLSHAQYDWADRVRYYAFEVAPEYRRWFQGIDSPIDLPRI